MAKQLPPKSKRMTDLIVVLDIDHTLLSTFETQEKVDTFSSVDLFAPSNYQLRERSFKIRIDDSTTDDGTMIDATVVKRPYIDKFLHWCNIYFKHVIIWSAGTDNYVHEMVDHLYRNITPKPDAVLARSYCEMNEGGGYYKPLLKLVTDTTLAPLGITYQNTVLIDDTAETFSHNVSNAIHIPPFLKGPFTVDKLFVEDETLQKISLWFMQPATVMATDIRTVSKNNIFVRGVGDYYKTVVTFTSN